MTEAAREIFIDNDQECFLSAASVWEMAIKSSLGKLMLATSVSHVVRGGLERGLRLLDVTASHAYLVERLRSIIAIRSTESSSRRRCMKACTSSVATGNSTRTR